MSLQHKWQLFFKSAGTYIIIKKKKPVIAHIRIWKPDVVTDASFPL